jgi:hypothetical protein
MNYPYTAVSVASRKHMTEAINQAMQEIVTLRAQRDALASVVVIAWARSRDGNTTEECGIQAQLLAVGLIEEIDWDAHAHRLTNFGREAMNGCGAEGDLLDDWFSFV